MSDNDHLNASLRTIAKGAGVSFIGAFIGLGLGYLSRIIIARWLGAEDYGLISLGFAGLSIATTLSLVGLRSGIKRYVSFYKGREDKGRIKGTILGALKISFPLSLLFTFLFFYYADWISRHVFHSPELIPVLRIFVIAIPFLVLAEISISTTIGFQDVRYRVYVNDLFQNAFKLVAIVALLVMGFGVIGAAWGWVLAIVSTPLLAFYFLEKRVFPIFNTKVKAISVDRKLFSFSWPLIFTAIAGMAMGWMDTIMIGHFLSTSAVGIYNAALPTARLLKVVLGSFGVIFLPMASELYARNKIEDLKNTYSTVTKWVVSIVLPIFLFMVLFSKSILLIMFGMEYIGGATALSILALGFFLYCTLGPANSIILIYGKTKLIIICNYAAAVANFSLNLLFIPLYGITGAAIATSVSFVIWGMLNLFFAYQIAKIQPFRMNHLKPAFASIISVLIIYGLTKYIICVSLLSLIIMFFIFSILYIFLLLIFKSFEEEDLMLMRVIDQRLGTKLNWVRRSIKRFL